MSSEPRMLHFKPWRSSWHLTCAWHNLAASYKPSSDRCCDMHFLKILFAIFEVPPESREDRNAYSPQSDKMPSYCWDKTILANERAFCKFASENTPLVASYN